VTRRYDGDCCPACGSCQIIPYVVPDGGEEYGYQRLACQVTRPALTYPQPPAGPGERPENPTA
jgi:hypothetical protein